ncbi:MAG: NUDIX domain-containing protein [Spirochaetes bacterium]|nr:NUDIX domain-containing protein [Spirochaetota bacterium]
MSHEERFDVIAWADGSPTGATVLRRVAHADGTPHAALHLWVGSCDAGIWHLHFQRRAPHKETFPDLLDATVGGHLRAGETWEDGLRETEEEIGIAVDPKRCRLVMRRPFEVRTGRIWDREWLEDYATRDDRPLAAYSFPDGEATALVRVPFEGLRRLVRDPAAKIPAQQWDGKSTTRIEVGLPSFNPHYFRGDFLEKVLSSLEGQGGRA